MMNINYVHKTNSIRTTTYSINSLKIFFLAETAVGHHCEWHLVVNGLNSMEDQKDMSSSSWKLYWTLLVCHSPSFSPALGIHFSIRILHTCIDLRLHFFFYFFPGWRLRNRSGMGWDGHRTETMSVVHKHYFIHFPIIWVRYYVFIHEDLKLSMCLKITALTGAKLYSEDNTFPFILLECGCMFINVVLHSFFIHKYVMSG